MIRVGGTSGTGMLRLAGGLRGAVAASPREEPREVAPVVEALMDETFDQRRAPDGSAWAPRKPPTGSWPLLERTGRMRRSRRVRPGVGAVEAAVDGPAEHHQRGTRFMVARKILPEVSLPAGWSARVGAARVRWWRERVLGAA